jgi:hypothetical protein
MIRQLHKLTHRITLQEESTFISIFLAPLINRFSTQGCLKINVDDTKGCTFVNIQKGFITLKTNTCNIAEVVMNRSRVVDPDPYWIRIQ